MKHRSEFLNLVESYMQVYSEQNAVNPGQFQTPASSSTSAGQFTSPTASGNTSFTGTDNTTNKPTNTASTEKLQGVTDADKIAKQLFAAQYSKFKELAQVKDPNAFVDAVRKMFPTNPNFVKQIEDNIKSGPGNLANISSAINKMVGAESSPESQSIMSTFGGTIE